MNIREIGEEDLKKISDYETLEKGRVYHSSGLVRDAMFSDEAIAGAVHGNHGIYYPVISLKNERLRYACSCGKKETCKHVIALALSWIYNRNTFRNVEEVLKLKTEREKEEILKGAFSSLPGFILLLEGKK